jgi:shikimate kinase
MINPVSKITLIGMPSSGKTTIGAAVAKRIGFTFLDLDTMVENIEGVSLIEVMEKKGADYFRNMEFGFLEKIKKEEKAVISPAGSIIFQKEAMQWIKSNTKVFFLDTPFTVIEARLKETPKAVAGLKERGLQSIWDERQPIYREYADEIIYTENKDIDAVVQNILKKLN